MKKGIHPLMRTCTVVLRNGASFNMSTVLNHPAPYFLQVVRAEWACGVAVWHRSLRTKIEQENQLQGVQIEHVYVGTDCFSWVLQDTTTHPTWTGQKEGLSREDERISKLLKRYEGFVQVDTSGETVGSK